MVCCWFSLDFLMEWYRCLDVETWTSMGNEIIEMCLGREEAFRSQRNHLKIWWMIKILHCLVLKYLYLVLVSWVLYWKEYLWGEKKEYSILLGKKCTFNTFLTTEFIFVFCMHPVFHVDGNFKSYGVDEAMELYMA